MTFTLEVEAGSDAMRHSEDIGELLIRYGRKFCDNRDGPDIRDTGKLQDLNGNTVGKWSAS